MKPPPRLVTPRLVLDPIGPDDAEALYAYRSEPAVYRYLRSAPASPDDMRHFVREQCASVVDTPGTWYQLAVRRHETGELIGDIGIRFPADDPHQAEVGFTVSPGSQRQGYGTEAVTAVMDYVFASLGKRRVIASADPRNAPSIALLKRLGMRQEAHFRESLLIRGEWVDDVVFAILDREWKARRAASGDG